MVGSRAGLTNMKCFSVLYPTSAKAMSGDYMEEWKTG